MDKELYVQDLYGGADAVHRLPVRLITEFAWHSLFIQHMLIEVKPHERRHFRPDFNIVCLPGFSADPKSHGCRSSTVIAIHLAKKLVLIGGTSYAGEMKKSVFTLLNYILPGKRVMSMHASANMSKDHSAETALFFGLSGTGKTTLSADPNRILIGDDEHGWSENGIFNIEGGCYAKMIRLSAEAEPEIFSTAHRFGTVLENVVMDEETRELDLDSDKYTENTRAAYPLNYIPNTSPSGVGSHPKNVILLTADAFGVMPPIAKLTPSQAMYHFLSGFTAKVAGTEKGLGADPEPTFSTCFAAPFLPRHPSEYGNLLRQLIADHNVDCWLVNTGWTGGKYGVGRRMPIKPTRALLAAALDGSLADVEMRIDPNFHFRVPVSVPGVDPAILNPRDTWADKQAYDADGAEAGAHVPGQFQEIREACRRRRAVGRAGLWPQPPNSRQKATSGRAPFIAVSHCGRSTVRRFFTTGAGAYMDFVASTRCTPASRGQAVCPTRSHARPARKDGLRPQGGMNSAASQRSGQNSDPLSN